MDMMGRGGKWVCIVEEEPFWTYNKLSGYSTCIKKSLPSSFSRGGLLQDRCCRGLHINRWLLTTRSTKAHLSMITFANGAAFLALFYNMCLSKGLKVIYMPSIFLFFFFKPSSFFWHMPYMHHWADFTSPLKHHSLRKMWFRLEIIMVTECLLDRLAAVYIGPLFNGNWTDF